MTGKEEFFWHDLTFCPAPGLYIGEHRARRPEDEHGAGICTGGYAAMTLSEHDGEFPITGRMVRAKEAHHVTIPSVGPNKRSKAVIAWCTAAKRRQRDSASPVLS